MNCVACIPQSTHTITCTCLTFECVRSTYKSWFSFDFLLFFILFHILNSVYSCSFNAHFSNYYYCYYFVHFAGLCSFFGNISKRNSVRYVRRSCMCNCVLYRIFCSSKVGQLYSSLKFYLFILISIHFIVCLRYTYIHAIPKPRHMRTTCLCVKENLCVFLSCYFDCISIVVFSLPFSVRCFFMLFCLRFRFVQKMELILIHQRKERAHAECLLFAVERRNETMTENKNFRRNKWICLFIFSGLVFYASTARIILHVKRKCNEFWYIIFLFLFI